MGRRFLLDRLPASSRRISPAMSAFGPTDAPMAFRHHALDEILQMLRTRSVCVMVAPPFIGKTSFAILLGQHVLRHGWESYFIPLAGGVSAEQSVVDSCGLRLSDVLAHTSKPTLLLFDDAQAIYGDANQSPFWDMVQRHESLGEHPVTLLFFSTARKEVTLPSPFVFSHRLPASLLIAVEEDLVALFDDYDLVAERPIGDYLRSVVSRLAGGHLGFLRQLLYKIFELRNLGEGDSDTQIVSAFLDNRFNSFLQGLRVTLDVRSFSLELRKLLIRALDGDFSPAPFSDEVAGCARLVSYGLLLEFTDSTFRLASPVFRSVLMRQLYSATLQ